MRLACALLVLACAAPAQDFLKLADGKRLRGEVVEETETHYRVIDRMGVLHDLPKRDVESVKRGKPLKVRVQKRLEGVDQKSAKELFAVVEWAAEHKALRRDAERLARRVLALDPEHAGARVVLGHVKALDTWYPDRETATKAVSATMKERGYVHHDGGWIKKVQLDDYELAKHRYVLVDGFEWRLYEEVQREKGLVPWHDEWYPKEQQPLLDECRRLYERTQNVAHVAEAGACRLYCTAGRQAAQETVKDLAKARQWFVKTFEINTVSRPIDREPICINYVLDDQAALETFVKEYSDLGFDPAALALSLPRKHATWAKMGFVIHTGENLWRQHLVSQLGGNMANLNWHWGFRMPDWIWTACAHHAEIAVYGRARVQYVAPDRYGRTTKVPLHTITNIEGWKELMRDEYAHGDVSPLRLLFNKRFNELTATDDIMGVTLLAYFLEQKKKDWFSFMHRKGSTVDTQFGRCLGDWNQVEHEFKEWVMAGAMKKRR